MNRMLLHNLIPCFLFPYFLSFDCMFTESFQLGLTHVKAEGTISTHRLPIPLRVSQLLRMNWVLFIHQTHRNAQVWEKAMS